MAGETLKNWGEKAGEFLGATDPRNKPQRQKEASWIPFLLRHNKLAMKYYAGRMLYWLPYGQKGVTLDPNYKKGVSDRTKGRWMSKHELQAYYYKTQLNVLEREKSKIRTKIDGLKRRLLAFDTTVKAENFKQLKMVERIKYLQGLYSDYRCRGSSGNDVVCRRLQNAMKSLRDKLNKSPKFKNIDEQKDQIKDEIYTIEDSELKPIDEQIKDNDYWMRKSNDQEEESRERAKEKINKK